VQLPRGSMTKDEGQPLLPQIVSLRERSRPRYRAGQWKLRVVGRSRNFHTTQGVVVGSTSRHPAGTCRAQCRHLRPIEEEEIVNVNCLRSFRRQAKKEEVLLLFFNGSNSVHKTPKMVVQANLDKEPSRSTWIPDLTLLRFGCHCCDKS
jgi:hypothetical protein